jgi:hypothetical protein
MSQIKVDQITDEAGTGAPDFPNGLQVAGASLSGVADQATAEAGSDNEALMTPLRTKEALASTTVTMSNKTLTGYTETVFALSGTTPALNPANGTIQTWTLSGNSSPTDSLATGQSITLMIDDGSAFTITWPTTSWVGGSAPTLSTTQLTVVEIWKVGTTLYGAFVGYA